MIVFLQIIFWTITSLYKKYIYKGIYTLETVNKIIDTTYFEKNKVIYNHAIYDAKKVLKFDPPLNLQRYCAVVEVIINENWRNTIVKVADFGCADLKFFKYMKNLINVEEIILLDIDEKVLKGNSFRIRPFTADYLCQRKKPLHVEIVRGSVDTPDQKLLSVDAVICIELIEHLYPDTLSALPHNIFQFIEPKLAIFTTPNADFNVLFKNKSNKFRHYDHKFEWNRVQFQEWAQNIVVRYPNYSVYFSGIGPGPKGSENLGNCTQMAVFVRETITGADLNDCISFGVCTYQSYNSFEKFEVITEEDYPFEVDNRTEEEIILHETEYTLHNYASYYCKQSSSNEIRVPFYKLTSNKYGVFISETELRLILEKAGWKTVEEYENGEFILFVIYDCSCSSSSSSSSHPSSFLILSVDENSDVSQFDVDDQSEMETNKDLNVWEDPPPDPSDLESVAEESPVSDPCVSGEQLCATDEKVELLFDSGYQVSTSSIELSPDLSKDWLSDERKDEISEHIKLSKSDKQCKQNEESPSAMKSEGHIFKSRKRNKCKVEEPEPIQNQQNRILVPIPIPVPVEIENPVPVVENGDLANNNRDVEGNNYQAPENMEQIDDNAMQQLENLDEHNENHIVLENEVEPPIPEPFDEDLADLEDASREVLYDPNSELSFSDEPLLIQGRVLSYENYNIPLVQRFPQQPRSNSEDNFRTPMGFPLWLLQMLNISQNVEEENAHFYSQGDGVGVHPSTTEVEDDSSSSSNVSSSHSTGGTTHNTTAVQSSTSANESVYVDAIESLDQIASGSSTEFQDYENAENDPDQSTSNQTRTDDHV